MDFRLFLLVTSGCFNCIQAEIGNVISWKKGPINRSSVISQNNRIEEAVPSIIQTKITDQMSQNETAFILISSPDPNTMMKVANNVYNTFGGAMSSTLNRPLHLNESSNDNSLSYNLKKENNCVNKFFSDIHNSIGSIANISISLAGVRNICNRTEYKEKNNNGRQAVFPPGFFPSRDSILAVTTTTPSPLDMLSVEQREIIGRLPQGMQNVVSSIVMAVQASSTPPTTTQQSFLPVYPPFPYYPPIVYPHSPNHHSVPVDNVLEQLRSSTPATTLTTTSRTVPSPTTPSTTEMPNIHNRRVNNNIAHENPNSMFAHRIGTSGNPPTPSGIDDNQGLLNVMHDTPQMGNGRPILNQQSNFRPNTQMQMGSPVVNVLMSSTPEIEDIQEESLSDLIPFVESTPPQVTTIRPMNRQEANTLLRSLFGSPILLFLGVVFAVSAAYLVIAMEQQSSQQAFQQAQLAAAFGAPPGK